jgi:hypothetical protein
MNGVRPEVSSPVSPLGSSPLNSMSEYCSLIVGRRQSPKPPYSAALTVAGQASASS